MPGERRVALTPRVAEGLSKSGARVLLERGAGETAGYPDSEYESRGVGLDSREAILDQADILAYVRTFGANPEAGHADLVRYRRGQILVGLAEPLTARTETAALAERGVTLFALELMPRITRAQSMDVLSSMATVAGYKAVLLAADAAAMFPMMMTAAGTIAPARVLVIGAGVAGLAGHRDRAPSRRSRLRVRHPPRRARNRVESLGARFVALDQVEAAGAEERVAMQRRWAKNSTGAQRGVVRRHPGKGRRHHHRRRSRRKAPILITAPWSTG